MGKKKNAEKVLTGALGHSSYYYERGQLLIPGGELSKQDRKMLEKEGVIVKQSIMTRKGELSDITIVNNGKRNGVKKSSLEFLSKVGNRKGRGSNGRRRF